MRGDIVDVAVSGLRGEREQTMSEAVVGVGPCGTVRYGTVGSSRGE